MNTEMNQALKKIDNLISKKGFIYALIMAQIEDETILTCNLDNRNSQVRLSSNEILFLWSLLVNKVNIWQYPDSLDDLYSMRNEITSLMEELHFTFFTGMDFHLNKSLELTPERYIPYFDGAILQEAIFYSGEALYDEEYIYYIKTRYTDDDQWLKDKKGYNKDSFCDIASKIKQIIFTKISCFRLLSLPETLEERMADKPSGLSYDEYKKVLVIGQFLYDQGDEPTLQVFCDRIRDAISFRKEDIAEHVNADNYLQLFSFEPSKDCNAVCKKPGDYSLLMSSPIIKTPQGHYLLTEIHQLFKSLYDVPRYWLNEQLDKHRKIGKHTGDFSEIQTLKVLKGIFGENCYHDIIIQKGKQQVTDIDVLCIWKDYAICFQIKTKGLTLSSRQGNIDAVRLDFEKCFQAEYRQGIKCREALLSKIGYKFVDKCTGQELSFPSLQDVYIICETSDEYPSLTQQMTLLLHRKNSDPAALAVNLFDLDVMGKYLNEPFYFLHYIHNRLKYFDRIRTDVESNCLYAYTYNRLFLSVKEHDSFMFDNSFAKAIDAELVPKYAKHEAITVNNSLWRDSTFDGLIKEINSSSNIEVSQIVLNLLNFSREEVMQIGESINKLLRKGLESKQQSFSIKKGLFGLTFIVLEFGEKDKIHNFIKAVSAREKQKNNSKNWLTIVHFQDSSSLVGTFAYI